MQLIYLVHRTKLSCGILMFMEWIILKDVGLPAMVVTIIVISTLGRKKQDACHSFEDSLLSSRAGRTKERPSPPTQTDIKLQTSKHMP